MKEPIIKDIAIEQIINILLIVACITFLLNDILYNVLPVVIRYEATTQSLISRLSLSIITGYIFYFLNVVLRDKRNKKFIYVSVLRNLSNIVNNSGHKAIRTLMDAMPNERFIEVKDLFYYSNFNKFTLDNLSFIIKHSKLNDELNINTLISRETEVIERHRKILYKELNRKHNLEMPVLCNHLLYYYIHNEFEKYADRILIFSPYLDRKLIKLINDVRDCRLYNEYHIKTNISGSADVFAPMFLNYCKIMIEINSYVKKTKLKLYGIK